MALLSNDKTPFARVLQFANELPVRMLKEVLRTARLSENVKNYLQSVVEERGWQLILLFDKNLFLCSFVNEYPTKAVPNSR